MTPLAWILIILAAAASIYVLVDALTHRILWRMAARNALRRPRQTATVIAGLMIGTAVISAAIVAGESAGSAIRGAVFDALGETDETIRAEGFPFYPQGPAEEMLEDPRITEYFDGAAPFAIWTAAAQTEVLFEPDVAIVGYDLQRDRAFGDFEFAGGARTDGSELESGQAYVTEELADALELRRGSQLTLSYTLPVDPLLPDFDLFPGVLTAGAGAGTGLLPIPVPTTEQTAQSHDFEVERGAKGLVLALVCGTPEDGCPAGTSLRLNVVGPDGTTATAGGGTPTCTTPPCPPQITWLNLTTEPAEALAAGTWTATIQGDVAAQTPYLLAAASLQPVYDLGELARRSQALQDAAGNFLNDTLDLGAFGDRRETTWTVAGITTGGKGSFFDLGPALFVQLPDLQVMLEREDEINFLKFSNPGDQAEGRAGTDEAVTRLNMTLEDLRAKYPDLLVFEHVEINPVKEEFLELADQAGELLTGLLIFAGSLTIITGLLLIVNIFTMLAEERRSELGMARAVGLRRRDVVRMFLFEGSLYAVAAAIIGSLLGLLLAFGLISFLNRVLAEFGSGFPPIPFAPSASAVPIAFSAGLLLTFVTIIFASRRQSRLNIVRAIRQVDEPEQSGPRWVTFAGIPLAAIGLLVGIAGWILAPLVSNGDIDYVPAFSMQVFGPLALALGMGMALRRRMKRSTLDRIVAALLFAYYVVTYFTISKFEDVTEANIVGPIRGVIMTFCIVLIVTYWRSGPRWLARVLGKLKRLRAIASPAMSYPQHKRFRTGMTLAMFSIVILSVGFFSIFGALFEVDAARHTGGFDVEATTTLRVPDLAQYDAGDLPVGLIQSEHALLDQFNFDPDFITVSGERTGQFGPPGHHVYGVDQGFVDAQEFRLLWTLDGATEEATYQRLLDEPGTVIVSYPYSTDRRGQDLAHEVGETLHLNVGDCKIDAPDPDDACPAYTIIGIQEQYHFIGIFLPDDEVERLFAQPDRLYLYKVDGDAEAAAKLLEQNYRDVGMNAEASQVLVEEEQQAFRQILGAMKLFLGLGLIIGVLSLGIVTSRSVVERRQEIGMLRAIGFTSRMVRRIFFLEVTLILVAGFIIGFLCSVIVTFGLWYAIIRELNYPYTVPWLEIFYLFSASYVVALAATAAPILRVGKLAPAEAVKYHE